MAKDGTHRGGRRVKSGPGKDALVDKIANGRPASVIRFPNEPVTFEPSSDLSGLASDDVFLSDMPAPSEYLSAQQKDGKPFGADIIYNETVKWLRARHCSGLVNPRLIESYANALARFIQCSEAVSEYGFIGKHPTTKAPIPSPFVGMEQSYQKQAQALWYEIFQIVKENSLTAYEGNPQDDAMERLLAARGG